MLLFAYKKHLASSRREAFLILVFILYSIILARATQAREAKKYEAWQTRFVDDYIAQQEAARLGMPPDPKQLLFEAQASELARVLYGVRDNSEQDLRTACWCVFNRVDSPDYPNTLEDVIAQPQQWMRYDPENPVIEKLYKIAAQELDAWQNGKTRLITSDFVYMTWSPTAIKLRNAWNDGYMTEYWRWSD